MGAGLDENVQGVECAIPSRVDCVGTNFGKKDPWVEAVVSGDSLTAG